MLEDVLALGLGALILDTSTAEGDAIDIVNGAC